MKKILTKLYKTFYNPRGLSCLLLFPVNLLVPFVITSIVWGYPMPHYLNTIALKKFDSAFATIQLPENVSALSKRYYFTGIIIDNFEREEERRQQLAEQIESGQAVELREEDEEERVYNGCDYFTGLIIQSTTPQEELSQQLIDAYNIAVEESIDAGKYKYFVGSHLRLVPVNQQSLMMQVEHKQIELTKKFDIKKETIVDGETYLVYMLYDNFNEYDEPRCRE